MLIKKWNLQLCLKKKFPKKATIHHDDQSLSTVPKALDIKI